MDKDDKLRKYEELLKEITEAQVKREGKVIAGPENGYYKVLVGNEELIAKSPSFDASRQPAVIMIGGTIVEPLPEGLITVPMEEDVDFEPVPWESIGGMKSQIDAIRKKVEYPTKFKSLYKDFNLEPSKGILLFGPPGCGKTLIAKAIATSLFASNKRVTKNMFVYLKGGELLDRYVGNTEGRIKNIFDNARHTYKKTGIRPIIFIDEAEAILPPRGSRISSDVENTIVPTFLSEMDGFEGNNPFVILATNFIERIDPAIQRPGRIDLKIYVGRPSYEDSIDIFKIHLKKTKLVGTLDGLAEEAAKYMFSLDKFKSEQSGALIENVVSSAVELAIGRRIDNPKETVGVTKADLIAAINNH